MLPSVSHASRGARGPIPTSTPYVWELRRGAAQDFHTHRGRVGEIAMNGALAPSHAAFHPSANAAGSRPDRVSCAAQKGHVYIHSSPLSPNLQKGLLAGGLADGVICLWNPAGIMSRGAGSKEAQPLARLQKHRGAVRGAWLVFVGGFLSGKGIRPGWAGRWVCTLPLQPHHIDRLLMPGAVRRGKRSLGIAPTIPLPLPTHPSTHTHTHAPLPHRPSPTDNSIRRRLGACSSTLTAPTCWPPVVVTASCASGTWASPPHPPCTPQ